MQGKMNVIQETMLLKILLFVVYLIQISLSFETPFNNKKEWTGYLNQKDIIYLEEKEEISFIVIGDWGSRLDNQYQVDSIEAIQASYNAIFPITESFFLPISDTLLGIHTNIIQTLPYEFEKETI